jgi:hypothetical protein
MEPLTTTINGFTVPATRNANLNNPQGAPTPAPVIPANQTNSQVITSDSLKPAPQVNIPVAPVASVQTTIPTFQNEADRILQQSQVEDSQAQQLGNQLSGRIFNSLQNLTGEKQALGEAQQAAGVGQFKQQLQDINSQILKKQAELQQDDIRLLQSTSNLEQQKIPMSFITGQQQSVERDARLARALKSSEIGILNASALATQGNIALAQETAQQAVDLKYAPYKEEIALYKSQLEALAPILSRDEKKQAREQELKANLALKDLDKREKNEKALQDILINASSQGAPADLVNRAKNAGSSSEAAMILGQYAGDFYKTELLKQQISTEKAQRAKIFSSIAKDNADISVAQQAAQTPEVAAWVTNIRNKTADIKDVPKNLKSLVSIALAAPDATVADPVVIQSSLDELNTIKGLSADNLAIAATTGYLRAGSMNPLYRNRLADWRANMDNVLSGLTVTELARVKNTGVTFGALSEGERKAVADAATALNAAKEFEGEGENRRWTGRFNASDALVKEQLKKIETLAELDFQKRSGGIPSSEYGKSAGANNPFSQALGQSNTTIPGTSIVNKVDDDGSIMFTIPK